jgi:F-type H+-transporting ATPase subunit delta
VQDQRLARRYANALFQAAKKADIVSAVESDLALIVNQLTADPHFHRFLIAPYTSREEKTKILSKLFSDRVTASTMQLLRIMMEKGREAEITAVYEEFVVLRRSNDSVAYAVVTSAEALDQTQRTLLTNKLESILKKRIEPQFEVDAAIIGGVRVKYENFILDGSVQGALGRLKEKLHRDVLKQS